MYNNVIKRIIDIVFSFICIIILLPIFLIISILIFINRDGEILFKQERIGKDAKSFIMYKFRTMTWNDKKDVAVVTKLGGFLRKTSLDELPQLFNILKGDMSFIGPRPWAYSYLKYFIPEQLKRCKVKPGISGWAQVNGRNSLDIFTKISLDLWYVDNISIVLDFKIILKTIKVVLLRQGAQADYTNTNNELELLKINYDKYYGVDL